MVVNIRGSTINSAVVGEGCVWEVIDADRSYQQNICSKPVLEPVAYG